MTRDPAWCVAEAGFVLCIREFAALYKRRPGSHPESIQKEPRKNQADSEQSKDRTPFTFQASSESSFQIIERTAPVNHEANSSNKPIIKQDNEQFGVRPECGPV